jgi:hypothetical protein
VARRGQTRARTGSIAGELTTCCHRPGHGSSLLRASQAKLSRIPAKSAPEDGRPYFSEGELVTNAVAGGEVVRSGTIFRRRATSRRRASTTCADADLNAGVRSLMAFPRCVEDGDRLANNLGRRPAMRTAPGMDGKPCRPAPTSPRIDMSQGAVRPYRGVGRRCVMCHAPRASFGRFRSFRQAVEGSRLMIDAVTPA